MILEVDIGNSNVKWRLSLDGEIVDAGSLAHTDLINCGLVIGKINYDALFEFSGVTPRRVNVVTVVVDERLRFCEWCIQRWGIEPEFAEVSAECSGVTNGYLDVSQMGPDRWLAMIAAYNYVNHDCLVIDSGSACTIDLVLANGSHLGGYIVPGVELMKDALYRDTDRVKLSAVNYCKPPHLGQSTEQAVSSGLRLMLMALSIVALDQLLVEREKKPTIVIAGGGAKDMGSLLREHLLGQNRLNDVGDIVLRPDLVLEGLSVVLR